MAIRRRLLPGRWLRIISRFHVGHVEAAAYRKYYSPFPEEMNRKLTGAIAAIHFSPTATARQSAEEGISAKTAIFVTGNTVIDALMTTVDEGV